MIEPRNSRVAVCVCVRVRVRAHACVYNYGYKLSDTPLSSEVLASPFPLVVAEAPLTVETCEEHHDRLAYQLYGQK